MSDNLADDEIEALEAKLSRLEARLAAARNSYGDLRLLIEKMDKASESDYNEDYILSKIRTWIGKAMLMPTPDAFDDEAGREG